MSLRITRQHQLLEQTQEGDSDTDTEEEQINSNGSNHTRKNRTHVNRLLSSIRYKLQKNHLKSIRLNSHHLNDEQMKSLADLLMEESINSNNTSSLEKFDIRQLKNVSPNGIALLICNIALYAPNIKRVDIEDMVIGDVGMNSISNFLIARKRSSDHASKCCSTKVALKTLGVSGMPKNSITMNGWNSFFVSLFQTNNTSLKVLDLSRNELTDAHVQILTSSSTPTAYSGLQCLVLSMNQIKDRGIEMLCEFLKPKRKDDETTEEIKNCEIGPGLPSLLMLSLADNKFTIKGLEMIKDLLQDDNCTIKRMYLYGNDYGYNKKSQQFKDLITYYLTLNQYGRTFFRSEGCNVGLIPHILRRCKDKPHIIYGLLTESPHLWTCSYND